jgi:hypothetical protein
VFKTRIGRYWLVSLILGVLLLGSREALAEDIEIGHLETADDTGPNWAFWACTRVSSQLHCHIFQTLIKQGGWGGPMTTSGDSCLVLNMHSEDTLSWNGSAWESTETAACSTTKTTLYHDPSAPAFWLVKEVHIYNGPACPAEVAGKTMTLNYTWKTRKNSVACKYIESALH